MTPERMLGEGLGDPPGLFLHRLVAEPGPTGAGVDDDAVPKFGVAGGALETPAERLLHEAAKGLKLWRGKSALAEVGIRPREEVAVADNADGETGAFVEIIGTLDANAGGRLDGIRAKDAAI